MREEHCINCHYLLHDSENDCWYCEKLKKVVDANLGCGLYIKRIKEGE